MIQLLYPFEKQWPVTQTWDEHKAWAIKNGWCWKPNPNCIRWYFPGIDFGTPVGTKLLASLDGQATLTSEATGYGWSVKIEDDKGNKTVYGHLSKFLVGQGQFVKRGEAIGLSGGAKGAAGAGTSTGPHSHFEYRENNIPTDPTPFFEAVSDVIVIGDAVVFTGSPRIRAAPDQKDGSIVGAVLPSTPSMKLMEVVYGENNIVWGRFDGLWIALKQGDTKYCRKNG